MRKSAAVMVAVRDLDSTSGPLIRKAAQIATALGTSVHLLNVIPIPYAPVTSGGAKIREAVREQVADSERKLQKLAGGAALRGLQVQATSVWDFPASDAIVRGVLEHKPAMLVIQSEPHSRLARTLLTNTDWSLIRHCPCPVWVSKRPRLSLKKVLAAVDPFHKHAKPSALDDIVLKHALRLVDDEPERVLAAHAFIVPAQLGRAGADDAFWVPMSLKEAERHASSGRERLAKLAAKHDIPPANQLVALGDPIQQLPQLATEYKAGVVVMGAVSRSGLKRIFIGNTAERIIDSLNTDLLVVKPRDFKTPVSRKPAKVRALAWPPV